MKVYPTPDKWSGEETRVLPFGITLNFKPYAAFTMFAVFAWSNGHCQTLYDGPDEQAARDIFNR
jgi:hypothetical protein